MSFPPDNEHLPLNGRTEDPLTMMGSRGRPSTAAPSTVKKKGTNVDSRLNIARPSTAKDLERSVELYRSSLSGAGWHSSSTIEALSNPATPDNATRLMNTPTGHNFRGSFKKSRRVDEGSLFALRGKSAVVLPASVGVHLEDKGLSYQDDIENWHEEHSPYKRTPKEMAKIMDKPKVVHRDTSTKGKAKGPFGKLVRPSTGGLNAARTHQSTSQSVLLPLDVLQKLEERRAGMTSRTFPSAKSAPGFEDLSTTRGSAREVTEEGSNGQLLWSATSGEVNYVRDEMISVYDHPRYKSREDLDILEKIEAELNEKLVSVEKLVGTPSAERSPITSIFTLQKLCNEYLNRLSEMAWLDCQVEGRIIEVLRQNYANLFEAMLQYTQAMEKELNEKRLRDSVDTKRVEIVRDDYEKMIKEINTKHEAAMNELRAARDQEAAKHAEEMERMEDHTGRMQNRIDNFNGIFKNFQKAYQADSKKVKVAHLKDQIAHKEQLLQDKEEEISEIRLLVNTLKDQIQELGKENLAKQEVIDNLMEQLAEKDDYGRLYNEEKYRHAADQHQMLQGEVKAGFLEKRIEDLERKIQEEEDQKELKEMELRMKEEEAERRRVALEEEMKKHDELERKHKQELRKLKPYQLGFHNILPPLNGNVKAKSKFWLLQTLRAIYRDKMMADHFQMRHSGLIEKLPEFVWSWFASRLREYQNTIQEAWAMVVCLKERESDLLEISIFKSFLDESRSLDELCFYLHCRRSLIGQRTFEEDVIKVDWKSCVRTLRHIMPNMNTTMEKDLCDQLKAELVRCGARLNDTFDSHLFLRFVMQLYRKERDRRVEAIQKMLEVATESYTAPVDIVTFSRILQTINQRVTDTEILRLYRESGGQAVNVKNFLNAADRCGFFVGCLRLPAYSQVDLSKKFHEFELIKMGEGIRKFWRDFVFKYKSKVAESLGFSPFQQGQTLFHMKQVHGLMTQEITGNNAVAAYYSLRVFLERLNFVHATMSEYDVELDPTSGVSFIENIARDVVMRLRKAVVFDDWIDALKKTAYDRESSIMSDEVRSQPESEDEFSYDKLPNPSSPTRRQGSPTRKVTEPDVELSNNERVALAKMGNESLAYLAGMEQENESGGIISQPGENAHTKVELARLGTEAGEEMAKREAEDAKGDQDMVAT